jgi:hypothetical protein
MLELREIIGSSVVDEHHLPVHYGQGECCLLMGMRGYSLEDLGIAPEFEEPVLKETRAASSLPIQGEEEATGMCNGSEANTRSPHVQQDVTGRTVVKAKRKGGRPRGSKNGTSSSRLGNFGIRRISRRPGLRIPRELGGGA